MARPLKDPDHPLAFVMTLKLSKDDVRKLARMARKAKRPRGEVLRDLLRAAKEET